MEHVTTRRQVFLPNTSPAYSNADFATLGLVLESITRAPYADALRDLLAEPLGLKGTSAVTPVSSEHDVIVGDETAAKWNLTIGGAGIGMGAMFSTANDLTSIGRAILNSTLLDSNTTRAWLKPSSHTSSLIGAVGRPWEIFRATIGPLENNRVVDLYTKSGNFGGYGANLVLIPDYDVGFVALMASRRGRVPFEISGVIVDHLLPALEEAARMEADTAFAGTYQAPGGLNYSLVLFSTPGEPGLSIDSWISNGTDMVEILFGYPEHVQLYPTNIKDDRSKTQIWRSSYISLEDVGPFSACPSWVVVDRPAYGVYGVDEFVFHLDEKGNAFAVEMKALKIILQRQ